MEQQHQLSELAVDSVGAEQLRSIAGWGKFLSIVGFIFCALMLLAGIFVGTWFAAVDTYSTNPYGSSALSGMKTMMTVIYMVCSVVFFIPTLFLYQASTKLKAAIHGTDQQLLNDGLIKMKATFRFWGIVTIIILAFYALAILFAIIGAAMV